MSEPALGDSLGEALRRGRQTAERTISDAVRDGQSWKEETVTDNLLRAVRPFVKYTTFTRKEESRVGADWMWWWVDDFGEAFGMLVQAKRPHGRGPSQTFDIGANGGKQLDALLATAREFGLAPAYSFYSEPRMELADGDPRTVTMLPGLVALWKLHNGYRADEWVALGAPLESLAEPAPEVRVLTPVLEAISDHELLEFLRAPQSGARNVGKHIFARVAEARFGQFGLATAQVVHIDAPLVFQDLPTDRGHGGEPYFEHVLRGLRRTAPAYVLNVLADQPIADEYADVVDGIAVFAC